MFQSFIKSVGLAPLDAYVEPRISIGNAVADREYSTGHFRIQLDAEKLALFIRNEKGRVIWKSLHNLPFLSSSAGVDEIVADKGECGVFKIAERDDHPTLLQTVTHVEKQDNKVIIYGGLGARIVKPTHMDYEFSLEEVSPHQLRLAARITRRDANMVGYRRLLLMFESRKEEHFYGFGEQFSHGSVKGQKVPILVRERGRVPTSSMLNAAYSFVESYIGGTESDFASYISVPHYITSDKRSMFLENAQYCSFNLAEPDRVIIRIDADDIAGRIIDRDSILDLIQEYTDYCGRMKPLPDWVMQGAIACIQGGSNKVQRILEQLIRHETPLAAVWLPDWSGQRQQQITSKVAWKRVSWTWESDSQLYPSWGNFVHQLREDSNVRVLTYMTPYLVDNLNGRRNLYREALDAGYLVKYIDRAVATFNNQGILAGLLDLTNEDARAWFKQALKGQIYDDGVSGLVADMAEGLPYRSGQVTLCSGQTPTETYHNKYAEDWAQLHREIAEEIAEEREMPLCIFRTGFLRSPKYASVFCTGNQDVSWDAHNGIKSALAAMLSGGFSGFSLTHSDIGGYSTIEGILPGASMVRSRELLFRWMELAAFTAVFRTNEGILPERNAQFYNDEETYEQFARMTKLYVCLAPYRKRLMQEAYEKGWPLMRHPVMYYPEDPTVQEMIYQQFFFGGDLLVAPNLSPSTAFVKVYFPRDSGHSWRHIWSGKYFEPDGSYKSVDAPLGQPAVFIKEPRQDDGLLNGLIDFANNYVAPLTT